MERLRILVLDLKNRISRSDFWIALKKEANSINNEFRFSIKKKKRRRRTPFIVSQTSKKIPRRNRVESKENAA